MRVMRYRDATADDGDAIARLHADSWRRNYRGAFSDAFLDGDVLADRLGVWADRLARPRPSQRTIVAEREADASGAADLVGFAHAEMDDDPTWGALLDNLHVAHEMRGRGIGGRLLALSAAAVIAWDRSAGLYLWVLEQNAAAQAFYRAHGGRCAGRERSEAPGGGTIVGLRYVWPDPAALLRPA